MRSNMPSQGISEVLAHAMRMSPNMSLRPFLFTPGLEGMLSCMNRRKNERVGYTSSRFPTGNSLLIPAPFWKPLFTALYYPQQKSNFSFYEIFSLDKSQKKEPARQTPVISQPLSLLLPSLNGFKTRIRLTNHV